MKRKLALLLAIVMTLSMLPMNVFAWAPARDRNTLINAPTNIPQRTLFYEYGMLPGVAGAYNLPGGATGHNDDEYVRYFLDGTDLVILPISGTLQSYTQFHLDLTNARWNFRADGGAPVQLGINANPGIPGTSWNTADPTQEGPRRAAFDRLHQILPRSVNVGVPVSGTNFANFSHHQNTVNRVTGRTAPTTDTPTNRAFNIVSTERWADRWNVDNASLPLTTAARRMSYDLNRGFWAVRQGESTSTNAGTYFRFGGQRNNIGNMVPSTNVNDPFFPEIPYRMEVAHGDFRRATVTILPVFLTNANGEAVNLGAFNPNAIPFPNTVVTPGGITLTPPAAMPGVNEAQLTALQTTLRASILTQIRNLLPESLRGRITTWDDFEDARDEAGTFTKAESELVSAILYGGASITSLETSVRNNLRQEAVSNNINQATLTAYAHFFLPAGTTVTNAAGATSVLEPTQIWGTYGDVLNNGQPTYWEIRIPLVILTDNVADDISIEINAGGNHNNIQRQVITIAAGGGRTTNTWVQDPETGRTDFRIDRLVIQETRANSIRAGAGGAHYTLSAPSGFEFRPLNDVRVGLDPGLTWGAPPANSAIPVSTQGTTGIPPFITQNAIPGAPATSDSTFNIVFPDGSTGVATIPGSTATTGAPAYGSSATSVTQPHYWVRYRDAGTADEDRSTLYVTLYNVTSSTQVPGAIFMDGLQLEAHDNAPWGDINLTITNGIAQTTPNIGLSTQTFLAAIRADWTISLTTIGEIPTLVNGRYFQERSDRADDATHKTARVAFAENSSNAWWAGRDTEFILSDGASFRMVEVTTATNIWESSNFQRLYWSQTGPQAGQRQGNVTLKGQTMTWTNLAVTRDGQRWDDNNLAIRRDRARIVMDVWVSLESGKVGDVVLGVGGSAIPDQPGEVPPIVIARQISPVTIETVPSSREIGLQFQNTSDIIITENVAGALERNKSVYISVSDLVADDVLFSSDAVIEVTNGDMLITNLGARGIGGGGPGHSAGTFLGLTGGTLSFRVERASSTPSTITISNVSVRVDRTVPETNMRPYQVIVWGEAVAPNYHFFNWSPEVGFRLDKFTTPGIMADYLNIVTPAAGPGGVLMNEVRVSIGANFFTVNGELRDMDAAAYISPTSNSTMVPIRFISNALGINDERVLWDQSERTVTVVLPTQVVQFQVDNSTKLINGVPVTMFSPDGLEVVMEQQPQSPWRTFVPFRALGNAFGIEVAWEDSTQTAIFNPGVQAGR